MERRLKERLVGAAILVGLIVLVVPELLSGPKQTIQSAGPLSLPSESRTEPMRTVTVDLDTRKTMVPETPPQARAPASAAPAPDARAAVQQPETAPSEAAPPEAAPPKAAPAQAALPPGQPAPALAAPATIENHAASPKSWAVQLGSFASHANAEQLVRAVRAHSAPAYVSTSGAGKSLRYRVRVGPLADRAAAERMLAKLKSEGQAASVIAP